MPRQWKKTPSSSGRMRGERPNREPDWEQPREQDRDRNTEPVPAVVAC